MFWSCRGSAGNHGSLGSALPLLRPCSPGLGTTQARGRDALTSHSLCVCPSYCVSLSVRPSLPSRAISLQMEKQLPGGPAWLPPLDLEKWYQEVMAGFETSSSPISPCSSPPPLPAKAHSSQKSLQVMPCSPRSPLRQRLRPWGLHGAKLLCLGEARAWRGLGVGCWSPQQHGAVSCVLRHHAVLAPLGQADPWCAVCVGQELAPLLE